MPTPKVRDLVFSQWWVERVEYAPEAWTSLPDLMADYKRAHSGAPMGRQAFVTQLNSRKAHVRKRDGVYGVAGLRLQVQPLVLSGVTSEASARRIAMQRALESEYSLPAGALDADLVYMGQTAPSVSPLRGDPPPPPAAVEDDGRYSLAPLVGGPATIGIIMVTPSEDAERSAQVARELFVARRRQVEEHGYTPADDDALSPGELAAMASAYAFGASVPPKYAGWFRIRKPGEGREPGELYPLLHLMRQLWRRSMETFRYGAPRELLVRAGGLLIAAIETLDRRAAKQAKEEERANG